MRGPDPISVERIARIAFLRQEWAKSAMGRTVTCNRLVSSEVEGDPGGRTMAGLIRAKTQGVFGLDERSLAVYHRLHGSLWCYTRRGRDWHKL